MPQIKIFNLDENTSGEIDMPVVPRKGEGLFFGAFKGGGHNRQTVADVSYHQEDDGGWRIELSLTNKNHG